MAWTTPRTWANGEVVTSTFLNTEIRDNLSWLYAGDAAWTTLTLINSWVNYDVAAFGPARCKRDGPWVELQGLIKNGVMPAAVAVLPAGYRPARSLITGADNAGGQASYGELRVIPDGQVQIQAGSNLWISLWCRFYAEQ